MSATLILETLGWVPVVWLVAVLLLVDRGRLPRDGAALRIAGCAAAAVVVTAAAVANMWPVAALGLLWLRTEVFAHRHPIHEFRAHREQARRDRAQQAQREEAQAEQSQPSPHPQTIPEPEPDLAHQSLAQLSGTTHGQIRQRQLSHGHANPGQSDRKSPSMPGSHQPGTSHAVGAQRSGSSAPADHGHGTRKALGPRVLDVIFKMEVMIVVIVALVILGAFAVHQRIDFNRRADSSVCRFMGGC